MNLKNLLEVGQQLVNWKEENNKYNYSEVIGVLKI